MNNLIVSDSTIIGAMFAAISAIVVAVAPNIVGQFLSYTQQRDQMKYEAKTKAFISFIETTAEHPCPRTSEELTLLYKAATVASLYASKDTRTKLYQYCDILTSDSNLNLEDSHRELLNAIRTEMNK